ncbi:unnamed protein product [Linum trigynum]|uniref:Myb/SANT-like domain-containing protein n=1 Tax=Linum trigynum TaxID=586398 RepID=A0AAV2FIU6_9ROSI
MEKIVENGDVDCVEIQKNDNGERDDSKIWGDKAESVFIDLLVEEVKKGNRVTSTFSPTGFANLIAGLKERLKRDYTKTQVKNKFNGLRGRLRSFKTLLSHTGVGYEASTGFVSAEEHVWESVVKGSKLHLRFRKHGCPEYDKLCYIFGDTTASGNNARPSTKATSSSNEEELATSKSVEVTNLDGEEEEIGATPVVEKEDKNKNKGKGKKRKRDKISYAESIGTLLSSMVEREKMKVEREAQKMASSSVGGGEVSSKPSDDGQLMECVKLLDEMKVNGALFASAVKCLHDSKEYQNVFLNVSEERRRDLLQLWM